jgi:hypothetical protein
MTTLKNTESNLPDPRKSLCQKLTDIVNKEDFLKYEVNRLIEKVSSWQPGNQDIDNHVIGPLSGQLMIDVLGEALYMQTKIDACENEIFAAKRRYKTLMERLNQMICDLYHLDDDEPIKVDIENMKIIRGDREEKINELKTGFYRLFNLEEEELKDIIRKQGLGTLDSDMAEILLGDHREDSITLCDQVFQAKDGDIEFLEKIIEDEDIPKPIKAMSMFIMKERGGDVECRVKKILELP